MASQINNSAVPIKKSPLHNITMNPSNMSALDKLTSILSQNLRLDQIRELKGNTPTIPINDLRGNEAGLYQREERRFRCLLASLYRLLDLYGWTQSIYNHISVRQSKETFLINPFGLLYHEVQASSLVKIDTDGNILDPGSTVLGINKAGWNLHSALHSFRPDVDCVIHIHLPDVIAVSCLKTGLLPVCPEATELLNHAGVSYHSYHGICIDEKERASIQSDLGPTAKVMFLRNHGVVIAAKNIPEAWYLLKRVISACQIQMRLLQYGGGTAYLNKISETQFSLSSTSPIGPATNGIHENGAGKISTRRPFENGELMNGNHETSGGSAINGNAKEQSTNWGSIEKEFEAQMRILDNAGFSTGYQYRQPNLLRRHTYMPITDTDVTQATNGAVPLDGTMNSTAYDVLSDRTSLVDFTTTEENVASAKAAGQVHLAKINDQVKKQKANKPKTIQNVLRTSQMDSSAETWSPNRTLLDDSSLFDSTMDTTTMAMLNGTSRAQNGHTSARVNVSSLVKQSGDQRSTPTKSKTFSLPRGLKSHDTNKSADTLDPDLSASTASGKSSSTSKIKKKSATTSGKVNNKESTPKKTNTLKRFFSSSARKTQDS